MSLRSLLTSLFHSNTIFRLFLIIITILTVFGMSLHYIEPESFPTLFDSIWWVIVTSSTVGYGDYVPETIFGRSIAILLILTGAGFVTYYMVSVSAITVNALNKIKDGDADFDGRNHIVIIGWNERSKKIIEQIISGHEQRNIILIDNTVNNNPVLNQQVYFIKGNPTNDQTLSKVNLGQANSVIITADQHKNETDADMLTILTLLAVKGFSPSIYSIVEILTNTQRQNAIRAGADEIIESYQLLSYIMVNSFYSHGISKSLTSLLNRESKEKITMTTLPDSLIGTSFLDCLQKMLKKEILVIGVCRGETSLLHPPHTFKLQNGDKLLVIEKSS